MPLGSAGYIDFFKCGKHLYMCINLKKKEKKKFSFIVLNCDRSKKLIKYVIQVCYLLMVMLSFLLAVLSYLISRHLLFAVVFSKSTHDIHLLKIR